MPDQNAGKSLDVSAKTVDEAIEQGLAQLGLPRDQVDIKIIKEGKRGVFGLGSEDAQVRLTPREAASAEASAQAAAAPLTKPAPEMPVQAPLPETGPSGPEPLSSQILADEQAPVEAEAAQGEQENVEEIAKKYLRDLLRLMGIEAEVTSRMASDLVEAGEKPIPVLDITGKDLGILIGRRSETLRALQYMVRLMVSKEMRSWQPIVIDVESYRVRRRHSLRQMAQNMAERAVATRKKVVLEAMPAYERRIVHITLKDHPKVFTKSVGSEDNRKVTIIPK